MAGHGTPAENSDLSRMARLIIKGRAEVQSQSPSGRLARPFLALAQS